MTDADPRPRLLDLFCGAGGAAMGYHRAGFDVVGVDIKPQKHYPFTFIQADATAFPLDGFDVIHASPPCQDHSPLKSVAGLHETGWMLRQTIDRLEASGLPYIVENVVGAHRQMRRDITLCAHAFGLRSYRHRIFQSNVPLSEPEHLPHIVRVNRRKKNRRGHWDAGGFVTVVGDVGSYVGPEAMGIDWMTGNELSQAIPPAYTEWIGKQLLASLKVSA